MHNLVNVISCNARADLCRGKIQDLSPKLWQKVKFQLYRSQFFHVVRQNTPVACRTCGSIPFGHPGSGDVPRVRGQWGRQRG